MSNICIFVTFKLRMIIQQKYIYLYIRVYEQNKLIKINHVERRQTVVFSNSKYQKKVFL